MLRRISTFGVILFLFLGQSLYGEKVLRVMSWNVRNYNLTNRYIEGSYRAEYPKPESEKSALRSVVSKHTPDVLLIQEMGGVEFLKELSEDLLRQYQLEYSYFDTVEGPDNVRKLGVLSKIPFQMLENPINDGATFNYFGTDTPVKRGLMEIELALGEGGESIVLMNYHLKSRFTADKRDGGSVKRREKEARLIRTYLIERLQNTPQLNVLMMGDLNDNYGSQPYNRITKVADRPILIELPVWDSNHECWTYFYKKKRFYEQIDFGFMSPYLADHPSFEISGIILGGSDVAEASDHRPLLVDIIIK